MALRVHKAEHIIQVATQEVHLLTHPVLLIRITDLPTQTQIRDRAHQTTDLHRIQTPVDQVHQTIGLRILPDHRHQADLRIHQVLPAVHVPQEALTAEAVEVVQPEAAVVAEEEDNLILLYL